MRIRNASPNIRPNWPKACRNSWLPGDMARIAQPIDWLGLNHYCPIYARADQGPLGFAWADAPT